MYVKHSSLSNYLCPISFWWMEATRRKTCFWLEGDFKFTVLKHNLSRNSYISIRSSTRLIFLLSTGSCCARVKWVITWPLGLLLYCTVPNCILPRWHRWFMVTFVASTLWIAIFSYLMVWMVRNRDREPPTLITNASGGCWSHNLQYAYERKM